MFKTLFRTLMASAFIFFAGLVSAKEIHVLRMAPAGGGGALWTDALYETLKNNGYSPKLVAMNSCKEAANWIKANPTKAAVYLTFSDYAIMDMANPNHPAACGLTLDESTLVTIVGRWWNFICGHADQNPSIEALRTNPEAKAGVWNYPISLNVAKTHLASVGYTGKVIGFASGKQLMLAFTSKDLDYIILSSENLARSLTNAKCFATSAAPADAQRYMKDRVSYASHATLPQYVGYGLWPYIAGVNIDAPALRTIFADNPGELYTKLASNLVIETAPIDVQLADLRRVAEQLKSSVTP